MIETVEYVEDIENPVNNDDIPVAYIIQENIQPDTVAVAITNNEYRARRLIQYNGIIWNPNRRRQDYIYEYQLKKVYIKALVCCAAIGICYFVVIGDVGNYM